MRSPPHVFTSLSQLKLISDMFTARKRSLGQGNIFKSVCQEFCSWGGVVSQHALQVVSQHALQQVCVLSQYALQQGRSAPGGCLVWGVCSWGGAWSRGSAPGGICSQGGGVPGGDPPRQLLLHAVRILLECILVKNIFLSSLPLLQPKINLNKTAFQ